MSILGATMMLAYVLGNFIEIPERVFPFGLAGVAGAITINDRFLIAVMTAGLAITGTTWLLHLHPRRQRRQAAQHWLLPGLSAWVLSIILTSITPGLLWWVVLIAGAGFLSLVWIAEFITVNPADPNFRTAGSGLTTLAFALYLILTINLRAIETRLIYLLPAASLPVVFITGRYLILKLQSQRILDPENRTTSLLAAGSAGLIAGQLATALHFFAISPMGFGLALLGPTYAANVLFGNYVDNRSLRRTVAEPAAVLVILWIIAIWAG